MSRPAVVVLGMHRSGTSALTRVLGLLGLGLPSDLMRPRPDNPTGFWESDRVVHLNEALLQSAGRSWFDPRPLSPPSESLQTAISEAVAILNEQWLVNGSIVIKDPRISRLGHVWLPALKQAGFSSRLVLLLRHPDATARSLELRNYFHPAHSRLLWLTYNLEAWAHNDALRVIVCYDDLLANWRATIETMAHRLNLDLAMTAPAVESIDSFLSPALRHHDKPAMPPIPGKEDLADIVYAALEAAAVAGHDPSLKFEASSYWQAWRLFGPAWEATVSEPETESANMAGVKQTFVRSDNERQRAPALPRPIIIHYNLFMNAGTQITRILRANFGNTWHEYNGNDPGLSPEAVAAYLGAHPWISVLSSHRAQLPPPVLPGTRIVAILFVRHPLDRVRLIYEFEHVQNAATPGAQAAKTMNVRDYVEWRLNRRGDRTIANFQTDRLAKGGKGATEADRALDALGGLTFVGLIEDYQRSLERLQSVLSAYFPQIDVKLEPATMAQFGLDSVEDRLLQLKEMIGDGLYDRLCEANRHDILLWETVRDAEARGSV